MGRQLALPGVDRLPAPLASFTGCKCWHHVRQAADGSLWCTCASWKYSSKPNGARDCKHTIAYRGKQPSAARVGKR